MCEIGGIYSSSERACESLQVCRIGGIYSMGEGVGHMVWN